MKKYIFIIAILLLFSVNAYAVSIPPFVPNATVIKTSTTNFNGNLSATDDNIQDALDTLDDTGAAIGDTIVDSIFLPIEWGQNGTSGPEAASVITSTNSAVVRNFDSSSDEDVNFQWQVPVDFTGTTIKFQVVLYVTNGTAPASGEGVSFFLQGASIGTGDALGATLGTAIESANADLYSAGAATQYDIAYTTLSAAITVTNITAGEMVILKLYRDVSDTDDDYGQDIGVTGIIIKYSRLLNGTL